MHYEFNFYEKFLVYFAPGEAPILPESSEPIFDLLAPWWEFYGFVNVVNRELAVY